MQTQKYTKYKNKIQRCPKVQICIKNTKHKKTTRQYTEQETNNTELYKIRKQKHQKTTQIPNIIKMPIIKNAKYENTNKKQKYHK